MFYFFKKLVGFCPFSLDKGEIYQINIDPSMQNKNPGKELYKFIEKKIKKYGNKFIFLNSTLNAVNFYKKLNFKPTRKIASILIFYNFLINDFQDEYLQIFYFFNIFK